MVWNPSDRAIRRLLKPAAHVLALAPIAWLAFRLLTDRLGFNPVEELTHETGTWGLHFLLLCLAMTPLRTLTGMIWLTQFRRMLGLYAFFYALCHFLVYFLWDQGLDLSLVIEDIAERPYVTVGFAALCTFIPLAATSTNGIRRRMKRAWNKLHKLVYVSGILVLLHFLWLTKADYLEPLIYTGIFSALMLFRFSTISTFARYQAARWRTYRQRNNT